ncbi:MAG: hypothetical protein GVY16_09230 [Planctomycetes bacterium]|jgi:hypothetical protein|nr:hypothetical protein [Planctomycetota bacterium]
MDHVTPKSHKMPQDSVSDKSQRRASYLPDTQDERFWLHLNELLQTHPDLASQPRHPIVFAAGAPRSGTTFLAQTLCQYMESTHVDNVAAKFWLAPVLGLKLSKKLFDANEEDISFRSEFGRTTGSDIHGFHYFWIHHLRLDQSGALFESLETRGIDPAIVRGHLAAMTDDAQNTLIMKGYYPSYFMPWFHQHIPGSVFVLIRRSPVDQARSIYRARQAYMTSISDWWSMLPPEIGELRDLSPEEQIAGQIFGLRRMYARQMTRKDVAATWVDYEQLLQDPASCLRQIHADLQKHTDLPLNARGLLPKIERTAPAPLESDVEKRLADALDKFSIWDEPWEPSTA